MRCTTSATRSWCSGSVVRMKKSLVASTRGRQVLEAHRVAVAQLARRDALALGRLRDRLAVLVGAREEEHVLAALAHVTREHVGRDRRVRVPEMGLGVHVVDRRGDVVGHERSMLLAASAQPARRVAPRSARAPRRRSWRARRPSVPRMRRASRGPGRRARERERPLGRVRWPPRGRPARRQAPRAGVAPTPSPGGARRAVRSGPRRGRQVRASDGDGLRGGDASRRA